VYIVVVVGLTTTVLPPEIVKVAAPIGFNVNDPPTGQIAPLAQDIVGVKLTYTTADLITSQAPTVPTIALPVQV
jgi:hypothetical protein